MTRQVARRLKDGRVELVEVPDPLPGPGSVAVRVEASVLSSGTERATLNTARKSLIQKARARPDQVQKVVDKVRAVGIQKTMDFVRQRLEELGPLGYSASGEVVQVGSEVRGISVGDRVSIAGGGMASHAELDIVSALLCARVPEGVASDEAAFTTLGAIALNGFRRAEVQVGSRVAVIGLGLIGQLALRIARAAGCEVVGIDLRPEMLELAHGTGAQTVLRSEIDEESRLEETADAVLICAATASPDPVKLAAALARDRAPVVVVGDVKMALPREPFYAKELDLRLSRSYGPGRYDPNYELHGLDYPIGYVRWTQQRNMEAFLGLVAERKLRPAELITRRFPISEAEQAFEYLTSAQPVGVMLEYGELASGKAASAVPSPGRGSGEEEGHAPDRSTAVRRVSSARFGLIGAGSFATGTLIPGLLEAGLEPAVVTSASGLSAESARRRFGFEAAVAGAEEVISRDDLGLIVIATRHDSHAELAAQALSAGKTVYVEKPLALSEEELALVDQAQRASGAAFLVGFNRRHAPLAHELRRLEGPRLMAYRVNAGRLAADHWTNDIARGGGRLKGEGCHFIDFLCDQAKADPVRIGAKGFSSRPELALAATDNFSVEIEFADASVGTLHYAADAPTGPGKERFEMSAPGAYAVIDDFKRGAVWTGRRKRRLGGSRQDKGFAAQFSLIADIARGRAEPPSPDSFLISSLATLAAARSLGSGRAEDVIEQSGANSAAGGDSVVRG